MPEKVSIFTYHDKWVRVQIALEAESRIKDEHRDSATGGRIIVPVLVLVHGHDFTAVSIRFIVVEFHSHSLGLKTCTAQCERVRSFDQQIVKPNWMTFPVMRVRSLAVPVMQVRGSAEKSAQPDGDSDVIFGIAVVFSLDCYLNGVLVKLLFL